MGFLGLWNGVKSLEEFLLELIMVHLVDVYGYVPLSELEWKRWAEWKCAGEESSKLEHPQWMQGAKIRQGRSNTWNRVSIIRFWASFAHWDQSAVISSFQILNEHIGRRQLFLYEIQSPSAFNFTAQMAFHYICYLPPVSSLDSVVMAKRRVLYILTIVAGARKHAELLINLTQTKCLSLANEMVLHKIKMAPHAASSPWHHSDDHQVLSGWIEISG